MTRTHVWKLAAVFAPAVITYAQTSRGTETGTILDASGAVIAGAHVTLTGVKTGVRLSTDSNAAGVYRFDAVDLGAYEIQVTHLGFRTYLGRGIGVEANRVATLDPRLEVGAAESRIEVSGESSAILIKDSPLRGGNFQPREVRDLPLVSLNPLSLARTLPGATEASGSQVWSSGTPGTTNGGGFSINGQRPRGNNYMLDGTENNDVLLSGEEQVFTIADAVEEVSVQTGNFGVEFGRAGGGVFNVVTKSGTNDLHGPLLWRYQSQRFNSVSSLNKLMGIPSRSSATIFSDSPPVVRCAGTRPSSLPVPTKRPPFDCQFPDAGPDRGCCLPLAVAVSLQPEARPLPGRSGQSARHGSPCNLALGISFSERRTF